MFVSATLNCKNGVGYCKVWNRKSWKPRRFALFSPYDGIFREFFNNFPFVADPTEIISVYRPVIIQDLKMAVANINKREFFLIPMGNDRKLLSYSEVHAEKKKLRLLDSTHKVSFWRKKVAKAHTILWNPN